jgi:Flp pilus assembly pilin Flp
MSGDHDEIAQQVTRSRVVGFRSLIEAISKRWSRDEGAAMVEYGLLLLLVLLAALLSVQLFGESLVALFDASANTLENAPNVNPEG